MAFNKGVKLDGEKPRMDLLPFESLEGIAQVLTFGAKKYESNNWRLGINNSRLIASLLRHLTAIQMGEDYDPESGLRHIDHVGCNALFLASNYRLKPECDDRYRPSGDTANSVANHPVPLEAGQQNLIWSNIVNGLFNLPTEHINDTAWDVQPGSCGNGATCGNRGSGCNLSEANPWRLCSSSSGREAV